MFEPQLDEAGTYEAPALQLHIVRETTEHTPVMPQPCAALFLASAGVRPCSARTHDVLGRVAARSPFYANSWTALQNLRQRHSSLGPIPGARTMHRTHRSGACNQRKLAAGSSFLPTTVRSERSLLPSVCTPFNLLPSTECSHHSVPHGFS